VEGRGRSGRVVREAGGEAWEKIVMIRLKWVESVAWELAIVKEDDKGLDFSAISQYIYHSKKL
jgi:hypothetical protein